MSGSANGTNRLQILHVTTRKTYTGFHVILGSTLLEAPRRTKGHEANIELRFDDAYRASSSDCLTLRSDKRSLIIYFTGGAGPF